MGGKGKKKFFGFLFKIFSESGRPAEKVVRFGSERRERKGGYFK